MLICPPPSLPLPPGALFASHRGRVVRRRTGREPGPRDHWPRDGRHGDYPLEPDAGHAEEARVHVAPAAQDLTWKGKR